MSFTINRDVLNSPPQLSGSVVAIGSFDGLHKGHQHLITQAKQLADEYKLPLVLLTFYPHPLHILRPNMKMQSITTLADKMHAAREMEIDLFSTIRFNGGIAAMSADGFVRMILIERLKAQHVVVGEDFHFGKKRQGNVELLKSLEHELDFATHSITHLCDEEGERYSSSRVRNALKEGEVREAYNVLGRPHQTTSHLVEDDHCNLVGSLSRYCILKNGVYWAKIVYDSNPDGNIIPVQVQNQKVSIKPLPNLPDIPEGRVRFEWIDQLNDK